MGRPVDLGFLDVALTPKGYEQVSGGGAKMNGGIKNCYSDGAGVLLTFSV